MQWFWRAFSARREVRQHRFEPGGVKIDITPGEPVRMAGYAARKGLSTDVHDPLSARVVCFEKGGRRLVFVSTDLIGFYNGTAEYVRRAILAECKLRPSELFLSAIHTHSGPSLTIDKEAGQPSNLAYTESLRGKLTEAVSKALADMMPAQMGTGFGHCPVGANRREVRADGAGGTSIVLGRNPYGPTDREVQVIKVSRADGSTLAAMFDYATHATCLGGRNLSISGDVMGLAEQFVEKIIGQGSIAPAFAGASGNIDPWFRVLPGFNTEPGWIAEPVLLGTMLGEEVVHVFRGIKGVSDGGEIRSVFETLDLPGRAEEGSGAKKDGGRASLNVTVGRLGDIGFVGIGCEVLTEVGMSIKAASPCEHTWVITHCNGSAGYLPPKELYGEGGYEVRSSPFGAESAEIVVSKAVEMLGEVFGGSTDSVSAE